MQALRSDGPYNSENQLKIKRDLLLKQFQGNPSKTRFAIEIKLIDETIATANQNFRSKESKLRELLASLRQEDCMRRIY